MITHTFPHPNPNPDRIADAIRPLMAAAGPYGFYVDLTPAGISITQGSWEHVDMDAVAAAIAATPSRAPSDIADRLTPLEEAIYATFLDLVNQGRTARNAPVVTRAQFVAAVKARL